MFTHIMTLILKP